MLVRVILVLATQSMLGWSQAQTVHLNGARGGARSNNGRINRTGGPQVSLSNVNIKFRGMPSYRTNIVAPVGFRASMTFTPVSQNRLNTTRRNVPSNNVRRRPSLTNVLNSRSPLTRTPTSNNAAFRIIPINSSGNATVTLPIRLPGLRSNTRRRQLQQPIRRRLSYSHGNVPISAMSVLRQLVPGLRNPRRQNRTRSRLQHGPHGRPRNGNKLHRTRPSKRVDRIPTLSRGSQRNIVRVSGRSNRIQDKSKISTNTKPLSGKIPKPTSQRLQRLPELKIDRSTANKDNKMQEKIATSSNVATQKGRFDTVVPSVTPAVDAYNGTDMVIELNRTLGKYGLDVDGLITLLQDSKNQVSQSSPISRGLDSDWSGMKAVSESTPQPFHQLVPKKQANKAPIKDNPIKALTDVRNELLDIALFLGGGNAPKTNQTDFVSSAMTTQTPPSITSTGNHVMDEMIMQLLFATMEGRAQ